MSMFRAYDKSIITEKQAVVKKMLQLGGGILKQDDPRCSDTLLLRFVMQKAERT